MRLFKYIPVNERLRFRMEARFDNIINHPMNGFVKQAYGGDANLNIESPAVGRIYSNSDLNLIVGTYRTITLGAKVEF
jgi:hypothetical protein